MFTVAVAQTIIVEALRAQPPLYAYMYEHLCRSLCMLCIIVKALRARPPLYVYMYEHLCRSLCMYE